MFNWKPLDIINKTFQLFTKHARTPASSLMKKTHHSQFTAFNVKRRSEPIETDAVYWDIPAIDDGSKCAQVFVCTKTLASDVYGMELD